MERFFILYDTQNDRTYIAASAKQIAKFLGCSRYYIYTAADDKKLVKNQYRIIPADSEGNPDNFAEEWNEAREKILDALNDRKRNRKHLVG